MLASLRHAFRILRKDPGFTAVAICSLALGIGATAAMFSFADAMLLRPLPVRSPDRVVTINTTKSAPFGLNRPFPIPTTWTCATAIAASTGWWPRPTRSLDLARTSPHCRA